MERIAKTTWRDSPTDKQAQSLPVLGPGPDAHLLALCRNSPTIQNAATRLGEKGLTAGEAAVLLNLPAHLAQEALAPAVERGRLQMLARMATAVTDKALRGEDKALQYWLKARGGAHWQDGPPPASAAGSSGAQVTQVIIHTGVPLAESPTAEKTITLTKRDFQHIPELRGSE